MAAPLRGFFKALALGFDLDVLDGIGKGARLNIFDRNDGIEIKQIFRFHYEYLYILILNFLCQDNFYSFTMKNL